MNKKQFALSAAAFVVALALVSCEPLRGHAIEIGASEQAGIYDYTNAGQQGLINIDFQLDEDEDGNRSKRLKIYALQNFVFSEAFGLYDNMDFSVAPDTVTFGGYGITGFYRLTAGGALRRCSIYTFPDWSSANFGHVFIYADDYSYSITSDNLSASQCRLWDETFLFQLQGRVIDQSQNVHIDLVGSGIGASYTPWLVFENGSGTVSKYINIHSTATGSPPVYSAVDPRYGFPDPLCGLAVNYTLPTGTVDTSEPWNYYNNVLLPYMEQEFPGFEQYFVFPDGYTPEEPPEPPSTVPTENPTLPGFDFALETNGTEPPTDVNFNIPDMPGKDVSVPVFDFTQINPVEVMAPVADGLRGLWQLISMVLTEYELFPYVALAIFAAIVVMLLQLGK